MYRYFKLAGAEGGEWPFDHPIKIGAIIRLHVGSGDALPSNAWNDSTKDWVQAKWVEVGDPATGERPPSLSDWDSIIGFIGENEREDDWGVKCVSTERLRELINELRGAERRNSGGADV